MQANALDSNLPLAKLGLAQIDLLRFENTNAITLLESTLQDVPGWMDALKVRILALHFRHSHLTYLLLFRMLP